MHVGELEHFLSNEIIVNRTGKEVRVALTENGQLAELYVDRGDSRSHVGNIYLGRVVRVLPGMQASFVDIGLERAAFLYAGDIIPQIDDDDDVDLDDDLEEGKPRVSPERARATPKNGQPPIQDLVKEGQEIIVQVAKDPIGTKGARITTQIAIPGRYMVYMPTVDHVGISRRIDRDRDRRKLREFVNKHRPKGAGFIVRTVCRGKPTSALKLDMDYQIDIWERAKARAKGAKAPAELHRDHGLVLRTVRDSFSDKVDRMVIDCKDTFDELQTFMTNFMPTHKDRVQLYRGADPIFDTFGIETEINRSLGRKVWLKSGGYLVIDQTEALTAIDVNSGKHVGSTSLEETTLAVNLEAVSEIVFQLRLRNIGGIIVLDFIDMDKAANRDKVYKKLEEEIKKDKARTNVLRISDLGLVEMTRKRVQEDLIQYISQECTYCEGRGHTRSCNTVVYDILREVHREARRSPTQPNVYVNAHPDVADLMYGPDLDSVEEAEEQLGKQIIVRAMGHYHLERFEVYSR